MSVIPLTLTAVLMKQALTELDKLLDRPVRLIVGGGGAMLMAYNFPLATSDIDAIPKGISSEELSELTVQVAKKLNLPGDWLNPWYATFTYVLREDYQTRLIDIFHGKNILAQALGREDLLLMKCFAHRHKDIAHARALLRIGADVELIFERFTQLRKSKIPGVDAAQDFLENVMDLEEA